MSASFRVAAIQACPVYLDVDRTIDKACALIAEAGRNGAQLTVFPEAFVPGYPIWAWLIPAGRTAELRELYAALHASSISIPGAATDRLGKSAREAGVTVAIGGDEPNEAASDAARALRAVGLGMPGVRGTHMGPRRTMAVDNETCGEGDAVRGRRMLPGGSDRRHPGRAAVQDEIPVAGGCLDQSWRQRHCRSGWQVHRRTGTRARDYSVCRRPRRSVNRAAMAA